MKQVTYGIHKELGILTICKAKPENYGRYNCKHENHMKLTQNLDTELRVREHNERILSEKFGKEVNLRGKRVKKKLEADYEKFHPRGDLTVEELRYSSEKIAAQISDQDWRFIESFYQKVEMAVNPLKGNDHNETLTRIQSAQKQLHNFLLSDDKDATKVREFLGEEIDLKVFSEILTANIKSMKMPEKFKNERRNSPMVRIVLSSLNNDMTKERYVASILYFGGRCCYCHKVLTKSTSGRAKKSDASGEHITPISPDNPNAVHGGTRFGNVVLACVGCNGERQNMDLEEWILRTRRIDEKNKPAVMGKIKAFRKFALYSDYSQEESKVIDKGVEQLNDYLKNFDRDLEKSVYSYEDAEKIKERIKIVLYDLQHEVPK